jgi:hypothetical protein
MRFFFDYTTEDQSLYDYEGNEFGGPRGAIDFAKAIAHDMKHRLAGEWGNWSVEVRSAQGDKIYSLRIDTATPLAA